MDSLNWASFWLRFWVLLEIKGSHLYPKSTSFSSMQHLISLINLIFIIKLLIARISLRIKRIRHPWSLNWIDYCGLRNCGNIIYIWWEFSVNICVHRHSFRNLKFRPSPFVKWKVLIWSILSCHLFWHRLIQERVHLLNFSRTFPICKRDHWGNLL